jgi:hypothetical protein
MSAHVETLTLCLCVSGKKAIRGRIETGQAKTGNLYSYSHIHY